MSYFICIIYEMSPVLQERTPAVPIVVRNIVFMRLLVHDVLVTGFENLTYFAEAGFRFQFFAVS